MRQRNLARLEQLEAQRQQQRVLVCFCGLAGLPQGQHTPGCPAADAGDNDHLIVVRHAD